MSFNDAFSLLQERAVTWKQVRNESEWRDYRRQCENKKWCYLIRWAPNLFSWGTSSGSSDRIRKSSIFNPKLTGKYDRRVDYLMLKVIFGDPETFVFEMQFDPAATEQELKNLFDTRFCYYGFGGSNREEISKEILQQFFQTKHYVGLGPEVQSDFNEYLCDVFFAKIKLAPNRTFHWGDSLEPNFLQKIDKKHLEPSIELALKVRF